MVWNLFYLQEGYAYSFIFTYFQKSLSFRPILEWSLGGSVELDFWIGWILEKKDNFLESSTGYFSQACLILIGNHQLSPPLDTTPSFEYSPHPKANSNY